MEVLKGMGMESDRATPNAELDHKLERIRRFLARFDLDGLLLRKTENFAWSTCGGDPHINIADSMGIGSLLITRTDHFVVTNNIETTRLMQEQGPAKQGWKSHVSLWYNDRLVEHCRSSWSARHQAPSYPCKRVVDILEMIEVTASNRGDEYESKRYAKRD